MNVAVQSFKTSTALNAEMSKSIPFLTKPKNLDGYVGNVEFDPLGFAELFDIKWLREAELKHGRAAQLATVGFIATQFVTLPGMPTVADSTQAPFAVGLNPMLQIVVGMGVLEWFSNKGKITMEDMFEDPERVPGNLGFDPQGYYKKNSPAKMAQLELQELKNGRLAMIAIGGMIQHNWVTGEALL
jgi:hypothetical protein